MRIGEAAERTGTPASTIRYYERVGVLPKPARVGGQRAYEPEVIEHLEAVAIAKELRFTLDEIGTLLNEFRRGEEPSQECRFLAHKKLEELEQLVESARRMRGILEHGVTCSCTSLSGCYLSGIEKVG